MIAIRLIQGNAFKVCSASGIIDYSCSLPKRDAEIIAEKANEIIKIINHISAKDIVNLVIQNEALAKTY